MEAVGQGRPHWGARGGLEASQPGLPAGQVVWSVRHGSALGALVWEPWSDGGGPALLWEP